MHTRFKLNFSRKFCVQQINKKYFPLLLRYFYVFSVYLLVHASVWVSVITWEVSQINVTILNNIIGSPFLDLWFMSLCLKTLIILTLTHFIAELLLTKQYVQTDHRWVDGASEMLVLGRETHGSSRQAYNLNLQQNRNILVAQCFYTNSLKPPIFTCFKRWSAVC